MTNFTLRVIFLEMTRPLRPVYRAGCGHSTRWTEVVHLKEKPADRTLTAAEPRFDPNREKGYRTIVDPEDPFRWIQSVHLNILGHPEWCPGCVAQGTILCFGCGGLIRPGELIHTKKPDPNNPPSGHISWFEGEIVLCVGCADPDLDETAGLLLPKGQVDLFYRGIRL